MIIKTFGALGISYFPIEVESDTRPGLFRFDIVGLADKTIEESKLRILSAIRNSNLLDNKRQNHKIVVLLCPAHLKKEGTHFDLSIAISYLQSLRSIKIVKDGWLLFGELGLKGDLKSVSGLGKLINQAKIFGFSKFVVPHIDLVQIENIPDIQIYSAGDLKSVTDFLTKKTYSDSILCTGPRQTKNKSIDSYKSTAFIIDSIKNQNLAKRALQISLAGKHHTLFYGPPGTGKSLLASAAKEIFAHIQQNETGRLDYTKFRSPHHTISHTQLIGNKNKTGEIHLAHHGILFLDEISEFNRRSLESLRQPLESGEVEFDENREEIHVDNKTDFTLIATSNLCKCGYLESGIKNCSCSGLQIKQYKNKLSGPILDRIDLCVFLKDSKSNYLETDQRNKGVDISGAEFLVSVLKTRDTQHSSTRSILSKYNKKEDISRKIKNLYLNKYFEGQYLEKEKTQVQKFLDSLSVSKRKQDSIVRVARTIADLEQSVVITLDHIIEASSYRMKN